MVSSSTYRFFVLTLFLGPCASANVSYLIGSGAAAPGSTVVLDISIAGGDRPAGLQWTLDYSTADISRVTVTAGPSATAAGKSVFCSNVSGGMTCLVVGVNTTGIADGVVAQATVQVAAGTTHVTTSLQLTGTVSTDANGNSIPSSGSSGVLTILDALSALRFVPITPCRVTDTRNPVGAFGGPAIDGGTTRTFILPSSTTCTLPASAAAYSLNVAVVPHGPLGYLTVWPSGQPQPLVAIVSSLDGLVKSTGAIIPAGIGGAISVYATDTTDVVLDVNGYFVPAKPSALAFYPLTPCRVADTREASGPLGGPYLSGNGVRSFPVLDATACNISSSAQAYSLNLAVVPHGGPMSYLTAWPSGEGQPLVATLNDPTGTILSNAAIVPAGGRGQIEVYVTNDTDLVIDINGYFAPPGAGGLSLYNLTPCRVLDTRLPPGGPPFKGILNVNVAGSGCGVPGMAEAYIFNATVVPPGPLGYLTLWPQGIAQPDAANLNDTGGTITANMAVVPTSNGSISAFITNPSQLVLDIFGCFAP